MGTELEAAKRHLEGVGERSAIVDGLPPTFIEPLVLSGLRVDFIERGHIVCSMKIPSRLLNSGNFLDGGATATLVDIVGSAAIHTVHAPYVGVSVEINVSYLDSASPDEEIEIDAKTLCVGKSIAVVSVEFRKKKTGKIFAQGRHTKYLVVPSKI